MSEEPQASQTSELSFWNQHRFLLLIALTIVVALGLVTVSLVMYNLSGAAQLDLSRPGFQSVASEADKDSTFFKDYSANGVVNRQTIQEFQDLYNAQASTVTAVDAFGSDPLNPDTLEFGSVTQE